MNLEIELNNYVEEVYVLEQHKCEAFCKHIKTPSTCKVNEERAVDAIQRVLLSPYLFGNKRIALAHC